MHVYIGKSLKHEQNEILKLVNFYTEGNNITCE